MQRTSQTMLILAFTLTIASCTARSVQLVDEDSLPTMIPILNPDKPSHSIKDKSTTTAPDGNGNTEDVTSTSENSPCRSRRLLCRDDDCSVFDLFELTCADDTVTEVEYEDVSGGDSWIDTVINCLDDLANNSGNGGICPTWGNNWFYNGESP